MRVNALELLYRLQLHLVADTEQELETEDRELIMAIAPLFREQLQAAQQQGRQEEQRLILENFLRQSLGELNPEITVFLSSASTMPVAEFTSLLLEISTLTRDELGRQRAVRLLADSIGKNRT